MSRSAWGEGAERPVSMMGPGSLRRIALPPSSDRVHQLPGRAERAAIARVLGALSRVGSARPQTLGARFGPADLRAPYASLESAGRPVWARSCIVAQTLFAPTALECPTGPATTERGET